MIFKLKYVFPTIYIHIRLLNERIGIEIPKQNKMIVRIVINIL